MNAGSQITRTEYELRDHTGRVVAYHVREETPGGGKVVRWRRPSGEWGLNGTPLTDLPLYGAELASDLGADELIVVAEGEKARDALEAAGIPAVGTVTGASGTPGPTALEVLRDRRVALWPDRDEPGRRHMERVAKALQGVAAETLWFTWDESPDKGDAADHPAVKGRNSKAVDRLLTNLEGSPRWNDERGSTELPVEVGRLLSEVVAEQIWWLWPGRVPLAKLTVLDGDPGNGKSAATMDFAARVTVGRPWPDGTPCEAGGVVLLNAEDGLADTIRPRLEAAGADLDRVLALATVKDGDGERLVSIPEDLDVIRRGIERVGAKLVIVDPIMAFLSGDVNSHRDQDVRRALAPLAKLAEETGAAVVAVRHLNKASGGNALYRGGGSIGIVGAARSALLVAKDPHDEDRRVLAPLKNNLAKPAPSLAFVLTGAANGAVRVEWKGESHHGADDLLAAPVDPEERSAVDEAAEFLHDVLGRGPVWSKQVKKEAREADISDATLRRAKAGLGVRSVKEGDGSWSWTLPDVEGQDEEGQGAQDVPASEDEHLEHLPIGKPNQGAQGEKQGAHREHLERGEVFAIDRPNSRTKDRQDVQDAQGDNGNVCIHNVLGGCWLCQGKEL
ncbi:MAG: AAA family ATPase [Actinomycetota bacterium]|nr:AAA family ATPase [Actinomycetota bacterium]